MQRSPSDRFLGVSPTNTDAWLNRSTGCRYWRASSWGDSSSEQRPRLMVESGSRPTSSSRDSGNSSCSQTGGTLGVMRLHSKRGCQLLPIHRHIEFDEVLTEAGPTLLLSRCHADDGRVARTFVYVDGFSANDLPSELRWEVVRAHGQLTASGMMDVAQTGRNSPCPCRSGRKFKHCHSDARI